jgi:hypothetical protein
MKFLTARLILLTVAAVIAVSTLSGQITTYQVTPTVTGTQISELDRRVASLEENKTEARLVKIETLLEVAAKSAEATRQTMLAVLVPVVALTIEALFRLASAATVFRPRKTDK